LWNAHLPTILQSSRHQNDPKYLLRDFTAELLQLVSNRLVNSVKSVPRTTQQWRAVEHALQILHDRVQYLKQTKNQQDSTIQEPRKLRIAIMGGSLLVGVNCRKVLPEMGVKGILMPNRLCTWSSRLQQFMNHLFGNNDVVTVDKIAIGGTNSDTGQTILNYQLMPHTNYDVLINAYSTNDMHYTTIQEAESNQQTLEERVFDIVQEYVRTALQSRPIQQQEKNSTCMSRPPLLLHMDDYLGNEQRQILETTAISKAANLLSSYYGFASMSYADMIRDLVYGNTRERWLSPNGWYENESTTMMREIHPSMAMHMASTWVTVFNLLNLALNYCSMHHGTNHHGGGAPILYQDSVGGMPNITHATNIPKGKPPYPPHGLPPPLTKDLSLEDVSELWRQSSKSASTTTFEDLPTCTEEQMESQSTKRCLFAWVADLSQQQNNETWIKEIFDARTVENTGWKLQNDHNKRGYVPSSVNARLVLRFETVTQPIQVVTLFYMRSYGDDWDYSRMQLSLFQRADQMKEWETISQNELLGGHEKNTSETYTFDLPLSVPVGSDLQISLEFKNGTKFKVQGLAVCS
jgi:lysophospholipase L1-like esterase